MARNTSGLKRGGSPGRPRGTPNKATREVRALAQQLLDDEAYRKSLARRLAKGRLSPPMEVMLWHYAYGKPKDTVQVEGALEELRVRILDASRDP